MKRNLSRFFRLLDKWGLLKYFNFSIPATINKKKFRIPVVNGIGYQLMAVSEQWTFDLYTKLLNLQQGTFVDVGVNNGQTLLKIASIQSQLSYIGFEPNPGCFYYVQKLAAKNKLTGYNLYPVGLYMENKIMTLISDNNFAAGATVVLDLRKDTARYNIRQNIPVMAGDAILAEAGPEKVSVLKVDVEGAETYVIKGLEQTIKQHQPFIVLEILPVYSLTNDNGRSRKQRQDELLATLHNLDYVMFRINEQNGQLLQLNDVEVHNDMGKTNYVFVPQAKMEMIKANFTIT